MIPEAKVTRTEHGLVPETEGWYVVNAREARWWRSEAFGASCDFEGEPRLAELGVNVHVLMPGQPNCMYHGESTQEDFLVLQGECLLLVEGQERRLQAWDFVHCPPWTEHVFVGSGDEPCLLLAVGARLKGRGLRYRVNETALKFGAGVEVETGNPADAYARFAELKPVPCPDEFPSD